MHILKQSELDGMPCVDTLIHGECLEAMQYITDGSISMILADLPYGTTACAFDTVIPFAPLWEAYKRVIKPNGAIVLTASQPFTTDLINSNRKWFRYEWIWEKSQGTNPRMAKIRPLKSHENICIFYDALPTYNPQMQKGKPYAGFESKNGKKLGNVYSGNVKSMHSANSGTRYPKTVQLFARDSNRHHPTQKPVALLEMLIKTYTNPGELVLDNVMGSATTPVACLNTGRHFIGIELDDTYFAAGCARVRAREVELASTLQF